MSKSFLERLQGHHERIDGVLEREKATRNTDSLRLARLKKLKLSLKDRIARIENALAS
jgi:hypothetical protein